MKDNSSGRTKNKKNKSAWNWASKVFIITLFLSVVLSAASESVLSDADLIVSLIVLVLLIILGVVFDMIGVAVTSGSDAPFLAMASKKLRGAKQSLWIMHNAEKVSNLCNDVIGDICGIVSGTAGATIAYLAVQRSSVLNPLLWSIIVSAIISALTVSFKALGKNFALTHSKDIVRAAGYILSFLPFKKG